jgi:putative transposase
VPSVPHHITQRGNNQQPVFASDDDRRFYLDLLTGNALRSGMRILGYCLMSNHVHRIAVPERECSLACALRPAHSEYALAFNCARSRSGHLWQNRFFSCPLESSHLEMALQYVDLNPVRAGLVTTAWNWPWSSARAHSMVDAADSMLDAAWREVTGPWDFAGWRERLILGQEEGESASLRRATFAGEPLGSQEFLASLERHAGRRLRVLARGRPPKPRTSGESKVC